MKIRFFSFAALALCTLLASGCSSAGDNNPPMLASNGSQPMAAPSAPEVCANHEQGCPCDQPGETTDCGRIKRVAGDYVWCSTGMQTCDDDGNWGACIGDQVAGSTESDPSN
ncbi:MAG TPA: hypothetical protein VER04_23350 [Polyangiaceae bacterium]|nr:hypothetical protein [Polyangiaceae bacterium]